jgi:4-aminobutyrate aminotransferase/(S)-3-amino-2-methylpropionate transaminase
VITFEGGYHGRTLLALTLTSKYGLFKKGFGPFAPEVYRLPAPNVYRRPRGLSEEDHVAECCASLDRALVAQVDPSAIAAVILEPVQGEAGFLPMPEPFLRRVRELCDEHGIVMIADEVQSGFGRTGRMFAIEHSGVVPDVVTMAKSLGAGMPIAATTGRAEIMDASHKGGLGGTFGGSPVACAAALAGLRELEEGGLLARATAIGERIQARLESWKAEYALVGDVRGLGAMRLFELVADRETREPAPGPTLRVVQEAQRRGLVMIRAGLYSNCVRLLPPLVISDEELDEAMDALGEALATVAG